MTDQPLTPETVKVGDGVSYGFGADSYPGTVVWVSASGKTIRFTDDEHTPEPDSDYYGTQKYTYTSVEPYDYVDPMGQPHTNVKTARWSTKRQRFLFIGRGLGAGRRYYQDPSY